MGKNYSHLSLTERETISILKALGKSLHEIGKTLNRHPSTISRELQSNAPPVHKGYYLGHRAHERSENRKHVSHKRDRLKTDTIRQYVTKKLLSGWSPEQIAGRISMDYPQHSISHEAVYQYIYTDHRELIPYLPQRHRKRQKRGHSRKHRTSHIPNRVSIEQRPHDVENRNQIGHWESDTAVSRLSAAALLVMVERKSRFTLLHKIEQKTAQATTESIVKHLLPLPPHIRRTITYDNGSENTEHETVNRKLGTQSYFCNPYHSWEKATVENTIGLVRRFFPKKTNFARLSPFHIEVVQFLLNKRPRKCLNYLTPTEVLLDECCT